MKKKLMLVAILLVMLLTVTNVKAAGTYEIHVIDNNVVQKEYKCTYGNSCTIYPLEKAGYNFLGYKAYRTYDAGSTWKLQWAKATNDKNNPVKWVDGNLDQGDKATGGNYYLYCASGSQVVKYTAPAEADVYFLAVWGKKSENDYDEKDIESISKKTGLSKGIVEMLADVVYSFFSNACKIEGREDPPTDSLTNIVTKVVGSDGYCNKDSSGNIKSCEAAGITTKFVCFAYSQVGYKEKKSANNLGTCTKNAGYNNYTKYTNSARRWDNVFVNWATDLAGVKVEDTRYDMNCDKLYEGELVKYVKGSTENFGILYKDKSGYWHAIVANYNNKVSDIKASKKDALPTISGMGYSCYNSLPKEYR